MSSPIPTPVPQLTTIHLVGSLGRAVGFHKIDMDVFSVAEALRAIDIVTNGKLTRYLSGPGKNRYYKVALQKKDNVVGEQELRNRSGRSTIYVMPTIKGRNSGLGKTIAGLALITLAIISQQYELMPYAWNMVGGATWVAAGTVTMAFGVSLLVGGITQLLTPKPEGPGVSAEQAQSTSFQGNASAVVQGGPVPVVYGRALMPAIPISITVENNDVAITDAGTLGTVGITRLPGGGIQYEPEFNEN